MIIEKNVWKKEGIIFHPENYKNSWINSHAYIPTPYMLNEDTIRIFVSFLDKNNVGRIGFVDVATENPKEILDFSREPVLDIGDPGMFDDNGVTPISIIEREGKIYLYYVGWQLSDKIRYFLFMGLAVSQDNGKSFQRISRVPILDRSNEENIIRSALMVIQDEGIIKGIYAAANSTITVNDKILPFYCLNYAESVNGIDWPSAGEAVISPVLGEEFGFGRPFVLKEDGIFKMWYSIRSLHRPYTIGYAESPNLKEWTRLDDKVKFIGGEPNSYDNEMMAFCSIVRTKYGNYMFYNGNHYGKDGICLAIES